MKTIVPIVAVCLAVIAASYAAVSCYKDKAAIARDEAALATREEIENRLTALMRQAIKEDRVPDAKFYYRTLKSFYPDWEYKEEEVKE